VNIKAFDEVFEDKEKFGSIIKALNESEGIVLITYKIIDKDTECTGTIYNVSAYDVAKGLNHILNHYPKILSNLVLMNLHQVIMKDVNKD
jgi:hypothetical protein